MLVKTGLLLYVSVDSIEAMIEKVLNNGGSVKVPKFTTDTGFTQAIVADSQGHVIGLQEERQS